MHFHEHMYIVQYILPYKALASEKKWPSACMFRDEGNSYLKGLGHEIELKY
jgi:hypothetical protein